MDLAGDLHGFSRRSGWIQQGILADCSREIANSIGNVQEKTCPVVMSTVQEKSPTAFATCKRKHAQIQVPSCDRNLPLSIERRFCDDDVRQIANGIGKAQEKHQISAKHAFAVWHTTSKTMRTT